jgi:hypothetical protein
MFGPVNPWLDFLEGSETGARVNFQSRIGRGFGSGEQDFLGSLFQPTFSRYLGALGRQINAGQAPTLSFTDYLNENFNPQREIVRAPSVIGPQLARPARFIFGR